MNSCLKNISFDNLTKYIDNFNVGMINFFDNLDIKYDELILECKKFTSEMFDIDNIKNKPKNTNPYSPGYNFINTNKNQRDNSPTELKEIVCISNNKVSEHIFVKTEQLSPNSSRITKLDNAKIFKKSKSFNDRYTFFPDLEIIKSDRNKKNKSKNMKSESSSDGDNWSDGTWDLLNSE